MSAQAQRTNTLDLAMMTPVRRGEVAYGRLHDEIYAALRHALMVGDLVPGQTFSIRALADRFGTSLIPVRDALKRLVAERALKMLPNRTVCVSEMTRERFQELVQVRLSLETMLTRKAANALTQDDIRELEELNAGMQTCVGEVNVKRYLIENQRFHFRLYAAAQSGVIMPIVESLWMQAGPFLNLVFTKTGTANARDNHAEILKALRRRDGVAAAAAVASDLGDAADVILSRDDFVVS